MLWVVLISTLIALAVTVPVAVWNLRARRKCDGCRYDLTGLQLPGVCPECGVACSEQSLEKSWERRWWVVPRVAVAVLIAGPAPMWAAGMLALMYNSFYGGGFAAWWYQATEREGVGSVFAGVMYLLNGFFLVMDMPNDHMSGVTHPHFWRRLIVTNGVPTLLLSVVALAAYHARFTDGMKLVIPAYFVFAFGFFLAWAGVLVWEIYKQRPEKQA